jgi:hypothetical protein
MKSIKMFEQFVTESKDSNFSHVVLAQLEPTLMTMLEDIKIQILEKTPEYKFSTWEIECIRIGLIIDMLKSFEKYAEPTDELIKMQPRRGAKGIEIYATIKREGQEYNYFTQAIGAGGYNIQSYHYRYLTKTNLPNPKIKNTLADEYSKELKRLSKAERINQEIKNFEREIEKAAVTVAKYISWTDEEIAKELKDQNHYSQNTPSWEEIIKRGANVNYDNDEAKYNSEIAKWKLSSINFWKSENVGWPSKRIESLNKEIKRLQVKLDSLI